MAQTKFTQMQNEAISSKGALWGLGLLFLGGCFLGVSPVIVKALDFPADVSAFFRVALATPLFLVWALVGDGPRLSAPKRTAATASSVGLYILAAVFFAADLATMHYAIGATSVAVATLFTNCAPFFVGILGLFGLTARPAPPFWKALPVALIGVALLIGVSGNSGMGTLAGDALALVAAALYAAYLVSVKALRDRGARPTDIMALVSLASAVILAPFYVASGMPLPETATQWALLLALAIVGQAAGQGLVTVALHYLPVSSSSLVLLIQPVIAALLSWVLLSEVLSRLQIAGIALVLCSIYLCMRPTRLGPAGRQAQAGGQ